MFRVLVLIVALWAQDAFSFIELDLKQSFQLSTKDLSEIKPGSLGVLEDFASVANFSAIPNLDERGFSKLVERQSCNPGYHPCSGGFCCSNGYNCVEDGCCEGDSEQCGAGKCYYPDSQQCCDSGLVCTDDQECQPDGCCPSGEEQCGSSHCYDPDNYICCSDTGTRCPKGYDCVNGGCCPSGQKPCGTSKCYDPDTQICCDKGGTPWGCTKSKKCCSTNYCYDPDTEICCENGACDSDTTCCDNECCKEIAYCGSDGFCSRCPDETKTVTATLSTTSWRTKTVRVTGLEEEEEPTGFSCVAMTVSNGEDGTLVLGTDCDLSYEPPETTSGETSPTTSDSGSFQVRPRQANCKAADTITSTTTSTKRFTSTTTTTLTITNAPSDLGFSCPEMEATNDVGDVLSLGEDCALGLSRANPTTTDSETESEGSSQSTSTSQSGGNSSSNDNAANSMRNSFGSLALLVGWAITLGIFL